MLDHYRSFEPDGVAVLAADLACSLSSWCVDGRLATHVEVAERACTIANEMYRQFHIRGWLVDNKPAAT